MSRYIDAELLKQILKPREWGTPDERWVPEHEIGAMLDYFPTADVAEVRHGRWVRGDEMADYPRVPYNPWETYCSCCGEIMEQSHDNFCGNCGAKMDGDTE